MSMRRRTKHLESMGALAAGLAHEIKNPLSTMSVNLQLMAEDFAEPEGRVEQRTLRRAKLMLGEVRRLDDIVNDFLSLARGYEITPAMLDLQLLVSELLAFVAPENDRLGIAVRSSLDPLGRMVLADPKYLRLALMNLIVNSQQAMADDGGELFVETRARNGSVEIRVTDTGPGMTGEQLARIWQPFFSTKSGGTGLGLPTTRRILEESGGEISVFSEVGRGTRFTVRVPGAPKQLPMPTEPKTEEGDES
ncbi:MAG: two-component system sensor histidine kinase HydH [Pseudohongiellaceae bacterium]|jgi:two-component system sensor histidine kinase HydH